MRLLPQALQKESEFKGFRPSITVILSSAACTDPDINLIHWQRFGAAWLKVLSDWHGFIWIWWKLYEPRSCDGECSSNNGRRPNIPSPTAESQAGMKAVLCGYFSMGKDSHVFQTIALGALVRQHGLDAKSLIGSLQNTPCCTPSMLLLPQALQKDFEFKGFRPSITSILSSAACAEPDINLPLATVCHSLAFL